MFRFYLRHGLKSVVPRFYYERRRETEIARTAEYDLNELNNRVDYYCKISTPFTLPATALTYRQLSIRKFASVPCLDLKDYLRYFPTKFLFECNFKDNLRTLTWYPPVPTFVKCRPVGDSNTKAVLMKLNSPRFFDFKPDRLSFKEKKPVAVFRGPCYREHRLKFVEQCHRLPNTDIGDTRKGIEGTPTSKPFLSPAEQLRNKFVVSIEGNDVSSSLMWIMASNSLALMTRPRFEGWFMQGRLIPDHHFVLLRDDYADLPEKIDYYTRHSEEALMIIENAHKHVAQFYDQPREKLISLLVATNYFTCSGQLQT